MEQGDINNIFHELHILLFEPPVGHDEENDINRDDFPGIVFIVEFEDEHGLLMHLEVRLPRYMTAFNPSIGLLRTQRALRELLLYLWIPDTEYNPLVSMLTWQTDVWAVTVHAAGESSTLGFYPLYTNNPPAARGEILTDDERPGPSHQVNHEASPGGSRAPAEQSSGSQVAIRQGGKRKRKSSGRSESREWKRRRSDHQTGSSHDSLISGESLGGTSTDDDQLTLSHRDNREAKAGGSRKLTDQSSQDELTQGGKRKRKTSGRSESREWKRSRSDHQSDSDSSSHSFTSEFYPLALLGETSSHDDQVGPSHCNNREDREPADNFSKNESKQGGKRKRKISDCPDTQSKRRRSDHQFDSSHDCLTFRSPPESLGEISRHDDQPGPSHQDNREARARASSAPAGQSSHGVSRFRGIRTKKTQSKRSRSDPLSVSSRDSSGFYGPDIIFTGNYFW